MIFGNNGSNGQMNSPLIRAMQPADLPLVAALETQLQSPAIGLVFLRSAPLAQSLVACHPGEVDIMGYLLSREMGPEWELLSLSVAPGYQRQGLATALMQLWMQRANEHAVEALWLEVRSTNEPAIGLYTGLGFHEQGRRKRYYPDADALLMQAKLFGQ